MRQDIVIFRSQIRGRGHLWHDDKVRTIDFAIVLQANHPVQGVDLIPVADCESEGPLGRKGYKGKRTGKGNIFHMRKLIQFLLSHRSEFNIRGLLREPNGVHCLF
eukprot:986851-Amorphochlora_amoeboformis.AAC.1